MSSYAVREPSEKLWWTVYVQVDRPPDYPDYVEGSASAGYM